MAPRPRRAVISLGASVLALLLVAAAVPAFALGAPPPGEGQLTITPSALAFGAGTVGTNSAERQIEVRNESGVTIAIANVSLQGAEPSEFSTGPNSCAPTLPTGQSCTIGVYFSPHSAGTKEASLRITSSDEAGEEDVPLSGTGVAPQLLFEPGGHDFGLAPIHGEGEAETEFQIQNTGAAPVHIDNIGFEGPGANSFNYGNSNCFGANLLPGEACYLQVRFRPQDRVRYEGVLQVTANGTKFTAALSGEGGEAIVTPTPSPVGFGDIGVGSAGVTRTITLTNGGDLPANYFIAFLTGGDVADFRLLSENCTAAPLEPGQSCGAEVRFAPGSVGAKASKLTFIAGGEDGPLQIDLGGTGVGSALSLGPAGLSFGPQGLGSTSAGQVATLTDSGPSPVEVDAVSITGPGGDQFRLADSCGGATLEPGQSCQVGVRFAPDGEGTQSATLRVLAGGQRLTASLTGTAVHVARVGLKPAGGPLRPRGRSLAAGTFACEAQSGCSLSVGAQLTVRTRVAGTVRSRTVGLRSLRLSVSAGETIVARFQLTAATRALLADAIAGPHLQLRYSWSTEGQTGQGSARLPLH